MNSRVKELMCEYLNKIKEEGDLKYSDFKSYAEEDGYNLTDKQLSAVFTKQGQGISIELLEKIFESLDIDYRLIIYLE